MAYFCLTQVELRLEGAGVVVLPRMELQKIPYLRVLTSLRWRSRARFHNLLPAKEWNGDLTLLTDLLAFLRDENTYRLPREWRRTFSLLRLTDMLGVDMFLAAVSRETCISVAMICKMLEESQCLPWLQNRASATALHYLQMYDRMLGWGHKGPVSLRREKTKFVEEWERTIHTSHLCNSTDRSSLCVPLSFVTLFVLVPNWQIIFVCTSLLCNSVLVPNQQIIFVCTSLLCNSVHVGSQPTHHLCVYLSPL